MIGGRHVLLLFLQLRLLLAKRLQLELATHLAWALLLGVRRGGPLGTVRPFLLHFLELGRALPHGLQRVRGFGAFVSATATNETEQNRKRTSKVSNGQWPAFSKRRRTCGKQRFP